MTFLRLFVITACLHLSVGQEYDPSFYRGYQVIGVTPSTPEQVRTLHSISLHDVELDFWLDATRPNDEARILVPPHRFDQLVRDLDHYGMRYKEVVKDVEGLVADGKRSLLASRSRVRAAAATFDYDTYHTYDEIMAEMEVLASKCRTDLGIFCETYVIGQSYEGRDQKMLKVYKKEANRHGYWMDSLIHAREWLAGATNLKIANHIITNYENDPDAKRLMDDGDWFFMFVHNPDGYVYTWTDYRLWRKNRYNNTIVVPNTNCSGVDLNRNFEFKWGNAGTSTNPCSIVYKGEAPADQIETQNVQKEIRRLAPGLRAFNTIHTAARLILTPWGSLANPNDTTVCDFLEEPEQTDVDTTAKLMAQKIQDRFSYPNNTWKGGNSCHTIYPASGLTQDYARGVGMIKYSFTPELRDRDANGTVYVFEAPPTEIEPSFQEMWDGFVTMVDTISPKDECPPTNGVEPISNRFFLWFVMALTILKAGADL